MTRFSLLALLLLLIAGCDDDDDAPLVVTDFGDEYVFERNGVSSVAFPGQTARLQMAEVMNVALLDPAVSEETLNDLFTNSNDPFTDAALNESGKSLRSKTAASRGLFFTDTRNATRLRSEFDTYLSAQFDLLQFTDQAARPGVPGQINDGGTPRYVAGNGLEYNQAFGKGLIGALMLDQIVNHYLDASVLDEGSNRADNDTGVLVDGKPYTTMEHKWDEAYGYLFGLSPDPTDPLATLGNDDNFLNKYLGRLDGTPGYENFAAGIVHDFIAGRDAVVNGQYTARDHYATQLKNDLSTVISYRAIYYLDAARTLLSSGPADNSAAFHDLSEAYGFVNSLRYTNVDGAAYFDHDETDALLERLLPAEDGFWSLDVATLDALIDDISSTTNLSL